eukprot:g78016.t1
MSRQSRTFFCLTWEDVNTDSQSTSNLGKGRAVSWVFWLVVCEVPFMAHEMLWSPWSAHCQLGKPAGKRYPRHVDDEREATMIRLWVEKILPRWNQHSKKSPLVRELCFQGIPALLRPVVWPLLVGNSLKLGHTELDQLRAKWAAMERPVLPSNIKNYGFQDVPLPRLLPSTSSNRSSLERPHSAPLYLEAEQVDSAEVCPLSSDLQEVLSWDLIQDLMGSSGVVCLEIGPPGDFPVSPSSCQSTPASIQSTKGDMESVVQIAKDVPRTFRELHLFTQDGALLEPLKGVLEQYACLRPEIGYTQGMNFVAAMLLLQMHERSCLVALANLLTDPLLLAFFQMDAPAMQCYLQVYEAALRGQLPRLHRHFAALAP